MYEIWWYDFGFYVVHVKENSFIDRIYESYVLKCNCSERSCAFCGTQPLSDSHVLNVSNEGHVTLLARSEN